MAFPADQLPVTVELRYDGDWTDVTDDVRIAEAITLTEGRGDNATKADPSTATLAFDNRDGKYSPRNPNSPLYGLIGRNTPLRVRVGDPRSGVRFSRDPATDSYASAPREAGDDITGDIDIRIVVDSEHVMNSGGSMALARRYEVTGDNRAWALWARDGTLTMRFSTDGDTFTTVTTSDTVTPEDFTNGLVCLRFTIDVNNGSGGHDVTFYTGPSLDGPFTLLNQGTVGGTISLFPSTADLEVGTLDHEGFGGIIVDRDFLGGVHGFQVRDGIDGTVVNSFTNITPGEATFTDDQGSNWTIHGRAHAFDASILFSGEVSNWPPVWSLSGADVNVPVVASGILRRLAQGRKAVRSSLFRDISVGPAVVGYWPCEDGRNATSYASAFGHTPGAFVGEVTPADYDGFRSSEPLPTYGEDGRFKCQVPPYFEAENQRVWALVHVPDEGVPSDSGQRLLSILTTGTIGKFDVVVLDSGSLKIVIYDQAGTELDDSGFIGFDVNGKNLMVTVLIRQEFSDVVYHVATFLEGDDSAAFSGNITENNASYGRVREVHGADAGEDLNGTAIGHVTVVNDDTEAIWDLIGDSFEGWRTETAAARFLRLTDEEDTPATFDGDAATTEPMGVQRAGTYLDLLAEPGASDLGSFGEARDHLALQFRARHAFYNQVPALVLDYSGGDVAERLEPVEDDQGLANDVTVSRADGSEYRATDTTGPLSLLAPPDGVGPYDRSVEVSLAADRQASHQAGWRLHLGTVDELRYPTVTVDVAAAPELLDAVNRVRDGDLIVITNPPAWLPPGDISLIVQRVQRTLLPFGYTVAFTCTPASPWTVGVVGPDDPDDAGPTARVRADTAGCELDEALSTVELGVDVVTTAGPRWTTDSDHLPFDIEVGGEVMRVSSVAGTDATQTFTVTRSINGVVKSHDAATPVRLAYPMTAAL